MQTREEAKGVEDPCGGGALHRVVCRSTRRCLEISCAVDGAVAPRIQAFIQRKARWGEGDTAPAPRPRRVASDAASARLGSCKGIINH